MSTASACGLSIGDNYQGGIIFYLEPSGCHGLICSSSDLSVNIGGPVSPPGSCGPSAASGQWFNGSCIATNATRNGIGAGEFNTERIISSQGVYLFLEDDVSICQTTGTCIPIPSGYYAAQLCSEYQGGNYGDWYSPSVYELNLMWLNLADSDGDGTNTGPSDPNNIGGFSNGIYWSSTEETFDTAREIRFDNGFNDLGFKGGINLVRAVRRF